VAELFGAPLSAATVGAMASRDAEGLAGFLTEVGERIAAARQRWTIKEACQAAKGLAGLDEHQIRRWTPCRRWTVREHRPADARLIDLICADCRLLPAVRATLSASIHALAHAADWSRWRRITNTAPRPATTPAMVFSFIICDLQLQY